MQEPPLPRTSEAVDWWLDQWGRGDVLFGNGPMSREDVQGLISGTGEGLYPAFRNLNSANLSELNLRGVGFRGADLGRTDLLDADLFRADLQEADPFRADLRGAFLMQVNMDSVYLLALRIDGQTDLAEVHWGA